MADAKVDFVWLDCTVCGKKNYRTRRNFKPNQGKGESACMSTVGGGERLEMKKFCNKCRKHTLHKESRKK